MLGGLASAKEREDRGRRTEGGKYGELRRNPPTLCGGKYEVQSDRRIFIILSSRNPALRISGIQCLFKVRSFYIKKFYIIYNTLMWNVSNLSNV